MNTGTIIGAEFDPNAANNQATFIITVPNPAAEEELPEVPTNLPSNGEATLPNIPNIEELMNLDPNMPLSFNPGSGNTCSSNRPGSGPGTVGGDDQLYRDQMYVRGVLSPPNNSDPNETTQKPEMPEWKIDTSLVGQILLATTMIATSAAATILGQRESKGGFFDKFGELYGYQKTKSGKIEINWLSAVLVVASWFGFTINPNVFDAIILLVGALGFFFNFIAQMMNSTLMTLYSIAILSLILILYAAKIANYPGDKMELIKKDLKDIIIRLKNMFSI